jgi:hypothetical protein
MFRVNAQGKILKVISICDIATRLSADDHAILGKESLSDFRENGAGRSGVSLSHRQCRPRNPVVVPHTL